MRGKERERVRTLLTLDKSPLRQDSGQYLLSLIILRFHFLLFCLCVVFVSSACLSHLSCHLLFVSFFLLCSFGIPLNVPHVSCLCFIGQSVSYFREESVFFSILSSSLSFRLPSFFCLSLFSSIALWFSLYRFRVDLLFHLLPLHPFLWPLDVTRVKREVKRERERITDREIKWGMTLLPPWFYFFLHSFRCLSSYSSPLILVGQREA